MPRAPCGGGRRQHSGECRVQRDFDHPASPRRLSRHGHDHAPRHVNRTPFEKRTITEPQARVQPQREQQTHFTRKRQAHAPQLFDGQRPAPVRSRLRLAPHVFPRVLDAPRLGSDSPPYEPQQCNVLVVRVRACVRGKVCKVCRRHRTGDAPQLRNIRPRSGRPSFKAGETRPIMRQRRRTALRTFRASPVRLPCVGNGKRGPRVFHPTQLSPHRVKLVEPLSDHLLAGD